MKIVRVMIISLITVGLLVQGLSPVNAQDDEPDAKNPVVEFLASVTNTSAETIRELQQQGYGLGNISKAWYFIQKTGSGDLLSVLSAAAEVGWGRFFKNAGLHPGGGHGLGHLFKAQGQKGPKGTGNGWTPPGQAKKDKSSVDEGKENNGD